MKVIRKTPAENKILNVEVVVPLKHLSNFWRSLHLSLINCEIELGLRWSKYCVIPEVSRTCEVRGDNPTDAALTHFATFRKNNFKLYVPVVSLSIKDNIKYLEDIS